MTNEQILVREFMEKFGQEVPKDGPIIPEFAVRKLRAKLILEEALEAIEALGFEIFLNLGANGSAPLIKMNKEDACELEDLQEPNLELLADALADLHYVGYCGTGVACGLDMEEVFKEVHRSNMSKFWCDANEADNREIEKLPQGITCKLVDEEPEAGVSIYLVKNKDGKVIKSPSYSPPNLTKFVESKKTSNDSSAVVKNNQQESV